MPLPLLPPLPALQIALVLNLRIASAPCLNSLLTFPSNASFITFIFCGSSRHPCTYRPGIQCVMIAWSWPPQPCNYSLYALTFTTVKCCYFLLPGPARGSSLPSTGASLSCQQKGFAQHRDGAGQWGGHRGSQGCL